MNTQQIKMKHPKIPQNQALYDPTTHYHYHYHYHYPVSHNFEQQNPEKCMVQSPSKAKHSINNFQLPEQMSFSSQQNEWKRYLNPKVSRMYEEYQLQQSRFSQKNDKVEKCMLSSEIMGVRKSDVMHKAGQVRFIAPQNRQLKKLDQLYNLQKQLKGSLQQKNKSEITTLTNWQSVEVQNKVSNLQKQIQRLRSIQQECVYLRDKFYLHIVHRHPSQK